MCVLLHCIIHVCEGGTAVRAIYTQGVGAMCTGAAFVMGYCEVKGFLQLVSFSRIWVLHFTTPSTNPNAVHGAGTAVLRPLYRLATKRIREPE